MSRRLSETIRMAESLARRGWKRSRKKNAKGRVEVTYTKWSNGAQEKSLLAAYLREQHLQQIANTDVIP